VQNLREIAFQTRALWMRFISTFKSVWTIGDYPVNTRFHTDTERWTATIINWPGMAGGGNTRLEALEDLRKSFERFKATKKALPRPGTKVPIEFATTVRVDGNAELAKDFIQRILEVEWAWISDESTLWDFHGDGTNDDLIEKIRLAYGVDVSDISSGNLADIFDRIAKTRSTKATASSPD